MPKMKTEIQPPTGKKARDLSLDRFRGLAIILMVIVNDLADAEGIPAVLLHPEDKGFSLADIVAPMFIFAIACSFRQSYLRRRERDRAAAGPHFVTRYLAILGIGAIFTGFENAALGGGDWGALQSIGVAGLLALLAVNLPAWGRALAGGCGLVVYQVLNATVLRGMIFGFDHGGLFGALGYGCMLILGTVMIDLWRKGLKAYLAGTGVLCLLAACSLFVVDISKNRVSLSFVLVSLAICGAAWLAFNLLEKALPKKSGLIAWWGENPMLLYVLHLGGVGLCRLPFMVLGMEPRPLYFALPLDLLLLAVLSLAAWRLHRKGKRIAL